MKRIHDLPEFGILHTDRWQLGDPERRQLNTSVPLQRGPFFIHTKCLEEFVIVAKRNKMTMALDDRIEVHRERITVSPRDTNTATVNDDRRRKPGQWSTNRNDLVIH